MQAIGRPLTAAGTKDLMVKSALVNGRNTRLAGNLVRALMDDIARQASGGTVKQAAAAVARASRKPRAVASAGLMYGPAETRDAHAQGGNPLASQG